VIAEQHPEFVSDAGPLIHLGELGALECLADLGSIFVPEAVVREVTAHRPEALRAPLLCVRRVAVTRPIDRRLDYFSGAFSLGTGEREALQLLLEHPGCIFLTDDAAARFVARQLGVEAHGSIGILIRAIRRGLKSRAQVLSLLESIPLRSSLHVRRGLLDDVLRQVRKPTQSDGQGGR
jgi:predicted nucleic acid-binding protein